MRREKLVDRSNGRIVEKSYSWSVLVRINFNLVVTCFCLLFPINVFALDIVYPKKNPVTINASSTFFIGSVSKGEKLLINNAEVAVSSQGAFAQMVPLEYGKNVFKFVVNASEIASVGTIGKADAQSPRNDGMNFIIDRPQPKASDASVERPLIEYPVMNFTVIKDGTPLRMTPVDGGVNRIAHLQEGVVLFVNAEKGNFYRVYLNSKLTGWVAKSDVKQDKAIFVSSSPPVKIEKLKIKEDRHYCIWEFDLGQRVPFVLTEEVEENKSGGLTLQLFNIADNVENTYQLYVPAQKLMGYDAYYEKNKLILKIRKQPCECAEKPLHKVIIAIDAGHGGKEFGAIGCCGEKEKNINLAIATGVKKELTSRGAHVVMTRDKDETVSLVDRVKFAREKEAQVLVSIHANALPDGQDPIKNRGTSVYYYHNQAKPLAESILTEMTTQLGTNNDKLRQGSLALVRPTSSVSVLVEVAYMINPDDYALLTDKTFQQKCAKAIADGIEKYILK